MSIDRTRSDTSNSGERRGSWYPMYSHRIHWIFRVLIISRIRRFLAGSRIQGSVRIQRIQRIRRIQIGFYENRNDIMKKYMILWKCGEYEQDTEDTGDWRLCFLLGKSDGKRYTEAFELKFGFFFLYHLAGSISLHTSNRH